jgi:hypothetical protein
MVVIATAIETGSVAQAENVWPATKEGVMSSDTNILIFSRTVLAFSIEFLAMRNTSLKT